MQPNFRNPIYKTLCKFRIFTILHGKIESNLLEKHLTLLRLKSNKIQFKYKTTILTEKKMKAQRNQSATNFSPLRNFRNVSKLKIKAQRNF